jgi:hypothetical protein
MKISETILNTKPNSIKRKKTNATNGFGDLLQTEETSETSEMQNTTSVGSSIINFNTLNILTSINDKNFIKNQNVNWGKEALSELENLRKAIVFGNLSYNTLQSLEEKLENLPYNTEDLELHNIIEEIKTRTSVELEKIKRFYGSKKE